MLTFVLLNYLFVFISTGYLSNSLNINLGLLIMKSRDDFFDHQILFSLKFALYNYTVLSASKAN